MELTHLGGNTYRLGLIIYFDDVNGQPGARDNTVDISVFRKADDALMETFLLPLRTDEFVEYTDPDCARGDLRTRKIYYSLSIFLPPDVFNHPDGYYLVHERCCRNGGIGNIVAPQDAAQAFYLEIPPVVKNGEPFINNSPRLFPPLSDYACINQDFYFDFSGSDLDGDSLAYSLATPLNGFSTANNPKPRVMSPGPYPTVNFLSGYSENNMVRGRPPLQIDARTGFLEVTPSELGLFVFSVKCEEFRDGEKIGEVVRDFQMLVLDCPQFEPPVIVAADRAQGTPLLASDTIVYNLGEDAPCFELFVTDPDPGTSLRGRVVPLNFPGNLLEITGDINNQSVNPGDTARLQVCLTDCPEAINQVYSALVLVGDNSCSLPLYDTVQVNIDIRYPNRPPAIASDDLVYNSQQDYYEVTLQLGQELNFEMLGLDPDGDSVRLAPIGRGFDLFDQQMFVAPASGRAPVTSAFSWQPTCDNLGADIPERSWLVDYIISDFGPCGVVSSDTVTVKVNLEYQPEPNTPPQIQPEGLRSESRVYTDTVYLGSSYELDISALDVDQDDISLVASGLGFLLQDIGISFQDTAGAGSVTSTLLWEPGCEDIPDAAAGGTDALYRIRFVSADTNDCFRISADTVELQLLLLFEPDPADAPEISIPGAVRDPATGNYTLGVEAGTNLSLPVTATDNPGDTIFLSAGLTGLDLQDLGMSFNETTGTGSVTSLLEWASACELLAEMNADRQFELLFTVRNPQACGIEAINTVKLSINLTDVERPPLVAFPNAFTPNGDNNGEDYYIEQLPPDTCDDAFESIEITNRWGEIVFTSNERDFRWDGGSLPSGVYYYFISYSRSSYKGMINLIRGNQ